MAKDLKEQIQIMTHYLNGGEVEFYDKTHDSWIKKDINSFNWIDRDYRIKEQKKTIAIEKWLCEYTNCELLDGSKRFFILEKVTPFEFGNGKKVKLLESKEIEL